MNQPEDLAQQRTDLATSLLSAQEQMAPIYDAADGMVPNSNPAAGHPTPLNRPLSPGRAGRST